MEYELYHDCFVFGDIFVFSYVVLGPNVYNYYKYPEGTIDSLGLLGIIFK